MPLLARMMNVFAVPGEVFDDVKRAPDSPGSWVIPILLGCLVGIVTAIILYSDPAVVANTRRMMDHRMESQRQSLRKQVDEGRMKQAEYDRVVKGMEQVFNAATTSSALKVINSVVAVAVGIVRVFWWAFALWLLALVLLRARVPYLKALEITGLASLIGTLGLIATLLLQVNLGRTTATPSLALAVSEFDPGNRMHMVLAALNLVQVWMVLVMGVGLARMTGVPFRRAGLLVMAFYFLQTSALVWMGAGMATL